MKVNRPRQPRTPSRPVLLHHYAGLLAKPNVIGCYVGQRHRAGKATSEVSLVCCVTVKHAPSILAKGEAVPRRVAWQATSKRRASIRTDVIEIPQASAREGVAGPGDQALYKTNPGTLGMAVIHPFYGPVVSTAAHLLVPENVQGEVNYPLTDLPRIALANTATGEKFTGRVLRHVMSPTADYALVLPSQQFPARNLFNDALPFTATMTLTDANLGATLFVATSRGLIATTFRGLRATIPVGATMFVDALLTDHVTVGGDSGAALVTGDGYICGLLLGFSGPFSVFMSPRVLLDSERATLAQGEFNETPL